MLACNVVSVYTNAIGDYGSEGWCALKIMNSKNKITAQIQHLIIVMKKSNQRIQLCFN